jgi:hypothetical protein
VNITYELDLECLVCCASGKLVSLLSKQCKEAYQTLSQHGHTFTRGVKGEADGPGERPIFIEMRAYADAIQNAEDDQPYCYRRTKLGAPDFTSFPTFIPPLL